MKAIDLIQKLGAAALLALLCFSSACSTDAEAPLVAEDAQISQAEFQALIHTEEWTGVADATLAELYQNAPGISGKAEANPCYEAAYTETGFTVNFGNCVLNGTENVNGTLVVTYGTNGQTASFTAVYEGFYVGDIELNGTRAFTLSAGEANSIVLSVASQMEITLADGSIISESGTRNLTFAFGETLADSTFSIDGNWTLEKDGNTYGVDVTSPLTGNFGCAFLVSGAMILSKNGLSVTVDLGDGTCDNQAVVTYPNGAQEELTL